MKRRFSSIASSPVRNPFLSDTSRQRTAFEPDSFTQAAIRSSISSWQVGEEWWSKTVVTPCFRLSARLSQADSSTQSSSRALSRTHQKFSRFDLKSTIAPAALSPVARAE